MKPKFKVGDKVTYTSPHGKKEIGMVKSISDGGKYAFVVYNCNEEWSRYQDYTGACTHIENLTLGWAAESNKP